MNYSPQAALLQSISCTFVYIFYCWHSWHYDRFRPMIMFLKFSISPRSRTSRHLVMRFIYALSLPLFIIQGIMTAYIKYSVGYLPIQEGGGNPYPYNLWPMEFQRLIYVIYILQALGWIGETVVHAEELCFWMYLMDLRSSSSWFQSRYFKAFVSLSSLSAVGLISIVIILHSNVLLTQAVMVACACTINILITIGFFGVLARFDGWLEEVKKSRFASELFVLLYGFGILNQVRVIFRCTFLVLFLILSIDGLTSKALLNHQVWAVDLIMMISLAAFAIQATLTLLIFLPRKYEKECGYYPKAQTNDFGPRHLNQSDNSKNSSDPLSLKKEVIRSPQCLSKTNQNHETLRKNFFDQVPATPEETEHAQWVHDQSAQLSPLVLPVSEQLELDSVSWNKSVEDLTNSINPSYLLGKHDQELSGHDICSSNHEHSNKVKQSNHAYHTENLHPHCQTTPHIVNERTCPALLSKIGYLTGCFEFDESNHLNQATSNRATHSQSEIDRIPLNSSPSSLNREAHPDFKSRKQ